MSQQIQISGGAKVRDLQDVIIGTSGVLSSLAFNVANGVPKLDVNGKILVSQLPNSVMEYKGVWNAATNTPTLANGTGNQGDVYLCNVAGTVDFGAGAIAFVVGDQVIYSGSIWQRASGATGTVTSVALTESGDSLNITGSPITTSGTINIGFNGTNLQYVNGAGNLTTFPILTGFVPYTGATANVDLGVFDLTADLITGATGSFASNGGSDTFAINHSSGAGIALNITKGGNGEGLYINKTSGSGNAATIIGTLNATTLVKNGGTSSQFLKADGTVDSNTYALDSLVVHLAGTETITGAKTFSGYTTFTSTVDITSGLTFSNSGFTLLLQPPTLSVNRTVTFADITGTIAMLEGTQTFTGAKTFDAAYFNGAEFINTAYFDKGLWLVKNGIPSVFTALQTTIYSESTSNNVIFRDNVSKAKLVFDNSTQTYTFPAASGTIALVGGSGVGTVTSVAALTIGTTGTDLSSSVANSTTTPVITLNVPTASATNRGALSSADWTTFNNKQNALTNPVTGTGTTNYLPKFTGTSTIGNSVIQESSSLIGINVTPTRVLHLSSSGTNAAIRLDNTTSGRPFLLTYDDSQNLTFINSSDSGYIAFNSGTGTSTTKMLLTNSGNLGLGVTPSAWNSIFTAIEIGRLGDAIFSGSGGGTIVSANAYFGASNWVYARSAAATNYDLGSGQHRWYTAPSGTAGAAITFTQAMTLTASGRLLIGTPTEASYMLDVNGTGRFSGANLTLGSAVASTNVKLYLNGVANKAAGIEFQQSGTTQWYIGNGIASEDNNFELYNSNGTMAMKIIKSTNAINFQGAATFSSSVTATSFEVGNGQYYTARRSSGSLLTDMIGIPSGTDDVRILTTGDFNILNGSLSNILTVKNGGNVGIGTSSVTNKLTVIGSETGTQITTNPIGKFVNTGNSFSKLVLGSDNSNFDAVVSMDNNATLANCKLRFYIGNGTGSTAGHSNDQIVLQGNGNVLIGTTDDGGKLVSYSTTAATQIKAAGTAPAISFSNTVLSPTIGGSLGACTSANQFLSGTAAGDMILINQFTGNRLYVTSFSGGVYLTSGATSWTANSDIRLKNINSHIENAVEKLSTLQTINFSYKDDKTNKQNLGLIAQEVEKIFPELIDKNGDGMLGVRYTELVPVLIKAIQEQQKEINELKLKIK